MRASRRGLRHLFLRARVLLALAWLVCAARAPLAQGESGSLRGVVLDKDFGVPLAGVRVQIAELRREEQSGDQGTYAFAQVPPGRYTLVFAKEGFVRELRSDVVVGAGQLVDVDVSLTGDFTEMEEFVVQDLALGGTSEAGLLELRFESAALLDSIGAELLSRSGASDAASALTLVSGATVQDGKYAVIRGLPDRYVSSQLNGVRLPSADEDTRSVELDQFPSAVIESVQVSKTFTPDQQGDASGGAVDVRLRGIPDRTILEIKAEVSYNTNVGTGTRDDFLTYDGGGVSFWGNDDGDRDVQPTNANWAGAVGVTEDDAPIDYKWSASTGGRHELDGGLTLGGFGSFFYERDSAFYDDGVSDSYVFDPGRNFVPQLPQFDGDDRFTTALYDVTRAEKSVQWGALGTLGLETENHALGLTYLYSRTTDDVATLAIDTRGKQYFFPGFDPDDPSSPGHGGNLLAGPYLRQETLEYTERTTSSLQLHGSHAFGVELPRGDVLAFQKPQLDWTLSLNGAKQDQPDKRQFAALWVPERDLGFLVIPAHWETLKPAANINFGNSQRIFETIEEDGEQASVNLKLPFEQWDGESGYLKLGFFDDHVERTFDQDSFFNQGDESTFNGDFDEPWSEVFPDEDHLIQPSTFDIDYDGTADIRAWYGMIDLPLASKVNLIGGVRLESTDITTVVDAEVNATYFSGTNGPIAIGPGDADVDFSQDDVLPAVALVYEPTEKLTLRASYAETVARQTFKELTPIVQQEFLGGPVFIGNPDLGLGAIKNYDLRADYVPYQGGLFSLSWFYKDLEDPIEFEQVLASPFTYTTPRNYPEGRLSGFEAEVRQSLDRLWDPLEGFALGFNATFIDSTVEIPDSLQQSLAGFEPQESRDATNAPEYLYNLYLTYDHEESGTQAAVFYTVRGDTLVAGASAVPAEYVPNVYQTEVGTLNFTFSRRLTEHISFQFKAKNLTDPVIEEVYRSDLLEDDVTRTSFTRGREFSIGLNITN